MGKKQSFNDVRLKIEIEYGDLYNYTLLESEYKSYDNKMTLIDEEGYKYYSSLNDIDKNYRRKNKLQRFHKSNIHTIYNIKLWIKLNKSEYVLLSNEYKKNSDKLKFKCNKGHVFEQSWANFKWGYGCNICSHNVKITQETFESMIYKKYKNEYSVISEYSNMNEKIKIKHNTCGNIFNVKAGHFIYENTICPKCSKRISKGELKIKELLENNNIAYEKEYTFSDLKNPNTNYLLRFDFAIFYSNGLKFLLEYDGHQHFEPIKFGGIVQSEADANFIQTKYKDNLKNQYCIANKIKLIRIPYWDFNNIKTIIESNMLAQ